MLAECSEIFSKRLFVVCGEDEEKWAFSSGVSKEVIVVGDEGRGVGLVGSSQECVGLFQDNVLHDN